jgi:hypothetical protein
MRKMAAFAREDCAVLRLLRRQAALLGLACLTVCCAGCVSVHVSDSRGDVRTTWHLGVLKLEVPAQQMVVASASGIGLIGASQGWSVGYARQRWAFIGDGCHAVIWTEAVSMDESVREELARMAAVCLVENSSP